MRKNKSLGLILIGIAIIFLILVIIQIDNLTNELMNDSGGTCVVDGKCIHEQD